MTKYFKDGLGVLSQKRGYWMQENDSEMNKFSVWAKIKHGYIGKILYYHSNLTKKLKFNVVTFKLLYIKHEHFTSGCDRYLLIMLREMERCIGGCHLWCEYPSSVLTGQSGSCHRAEWTIGPPSSKPQCKLIQKQKETNACTFCVRVSSYSPCYIYGLLPHFPSTFARFIIF